MTGTASNVDQTSTSVEKPSTIQPAKRDRARYHADYHRRKQLDRATPEGRLVLRTKFLLKTNLREYGPRLAKILDKFEGEIQTQRK